MHRTDQSLNAFFTQNEWVMQVTLMDVLGSSPRNAGTVMYVAANALWGTIGGGQLEFMVIKRAREMLGNTMISDSIDIPLGPEIGQCCGGRVKVSLNLMTPRNKKNALEYAERANTELPHVYIMGAGHVGRALANQLQYMPVHCVLIDTRADEVARCNAQVETRISAIPEFDIQTAPKGSAFVVLTHDHALDFLLTSAALERGDASYVGMIGSATKRAKFASWCKTQCDGQTIQDLNCPIGASGSHDKRPSVIAAFVAAEIIAELTSQPAATALNKGFALSGGKQLTGRKIDEVRTPISILRSTGIGNHHERPKIH